MIANIEYFHQFELKLNDLENSPELARELLNQMEKENEIKKKNNDVLTQMTNDVMNSDYSDEERKLYLETVSANKL